MILYIVILVMATGTVDCNHMQLTASLCAACGCTSTSGYDESGNDAEANSRGESGRMKMWRTPLHHAAIEGKTALVETLLGKGAVVDLPDEQGLTALHLAGMKNHEKVVEMLLQHGANVNGRTSNGSTVLHLAALNRNLPAVGHILGIEGVMVSVRDNAMETPLDIARRLGFMEVAHKLREKMAELDAHLIKAAETSDWKEVTALLRKGASRNVIGAEESLLHRAVRARNSALVDYLIRMGANTNVLTRTGWSPLHIAVTNGEVGIVESLLAKGALVDLPNKEGLTPVHLAAINNHEQIMRMLVDRGANLNARTSNGSTLLHLLAASGNFPAVRICLENLNITVNKKDDAMETPRDIATRLGFKDMAQLFQQKELDLNSALSKAAENGQSDDVIHLIARGASTNSNDSSGETPLHKATSRSDLAMMNCLIRNGANVSGQSHNGWTPMHVAVSSGSYEAVKNLLAHGANVETSTKDGETALILAAIGNHRDIAKLLLDNRANVNAKTINESTALHIASQKGNKHIVQDLLNASNVSVTATNNAEETPLMLAEHGGHTDVVKLLKAHIGEISPGRLLEAAKRGSLGEVKSLVQKGANVEEKDKLHKTPLWWAVYNGHKDVANFLVQAGARLDAKDMYGKSPLFWAAHNGQLDMVRLLVENGADVENKDKYGDTAMREAALQGELDIVKYLVDKGASVKTKNKHGSSALTAAVQSGRLDLVEFLVEKGAVLNDRDNSGRSPLSESSCFSIVNFLIHKGARLESRDVNAIFWRGATNGDLGMAEFALARGADLKHVGDKALIAASSGGYIDVVKFLVNRGVDVNVRDKFGRSSLSEGKTLGIVQYLMENGARLGEDDIKAISSRAAYTGDMNMLEHLHSLKVGLKDRSLLEIATSAGRTEVVNYLKSIAATS